MPSQGRNLHTYTSRKGILECIWDWAFIVWSYWLLIIGLQASCVSSATLDKLSIVSLIGSGILPGLPHRLTVRMFNFGTDESDWFQHYWASKASWWPRFHLPWIAFPIVIVWVVFPIPGKHPATEPEQQLSHLTAEHVTGNSKTQVCPLSPKWNAGFLFQRYALTSQCFTFSSSSSRPVITQPI